MDDTFHTVDSPRTRPCGALLAMLLACGLSATSGAAADMGVVPLFDGERNELLNTWGGPWGVGNAQGIRAESREVYRGRRAVCVELGAAKDGQPRYVQCFASGFGRVKGYHQTRDLTRYERLVFHARNRTGADLGGAVEIKDHRDARDHSAAWQFDLPAVAAWTRVEIPLSTDAPGWTLQGRPDLGRVLAMEFAFAAPTAGKIDLDDLVLVERGGPVDIDQAPLPLLVERLARRQWDGLWAARSRDHGLIPNNSYQSTDAGLNTTSAVLWMLPAATRRQWVSQDEADRYVETLVHTFNGLMDRAKHLPPRNVDWVTRRPSLLPEESSVDAAFLALALHQYKSLSSTRPALAQAIGELLERFDFASFACPAGWRMAYRYAGRRGVEGFAALTYDGYTCEGQLISLAAHLSTRRPVPIETHWNTNVHRARARMGSRAPEPMVHSMREFRAPFTQALWNLFVDVRERGADCFPDNELAVNPWHNFVCYEQNVMARLAEVGRPHLVQPDAGDDGSLANYQQFSLYEDFGQSDLFMPWSVSFALLAGADGAEESLRFLLRHGLHGPLGLADSAKWATGAASPYAVTARHDFWNTGLATMALLEWLDGPERRSKSFAEVPAVRSALDRVFQPALRVSAAR